MIETLVSHTFVESCYKDLLEKCLAHFGHNFDIYKFLEEVNALLDSSYHVHWSIEPLPVSTSVPIPLIIEPPKLELKPLPDTLKYAFLGDSEILPVIISSHLDKDQEGKLLDVLIEHKEALGWTIADIKGISPSIVMHHIHLKEDAKTSREPQRCLNPILKELVRAEVMKLLDTAII